MKKVIAGCIDLMLEFDSASELKEKRYSIRGTAKIRGL